VQTPVDQEAPKEKECRRCREVTSDFGKNVSCPDRLERVCKKCQAAERERRRGVLRAQGRARYRLNRSKILARTGAYERANRERYNEWRRTRRARNAAREREKERAYRARNPERHREAGKRWAAANPEKVAAKEQRRRATLAMVGGSYTAEEWESLLERTGRRCLACGSVDAPLTADHVISINHGGRNWIENIQPLCGPCNSKKGTKLKDYRWQDDDPKAIVDALVQAKIDLRNAKDDYVREKARAEGRAIAAVGGEAKLGRNAESRERSLVIAISDDQKYRSALSRLRETESRVDLMEAHLERVTTERRAYEWHVRERLADALLELATRPCTAALDHVLANTSVESTGEDGPYAGESRWVRDQRAS
jgi:5-methylcytosine-specific restriction endonuclease McrA